MSSAAAQSSVLLWAASACIAFLCGRTFLEFLRRLNYEGPVRLWRELLLCAATLGCGLWSSLIIEISAQANTFDLGYHPLKIFGCLLGISLLLVLVIGWMTFRPVWLPRLAASALVAVLVIVLQMGVIWSIGAEPGLLWRTESLVFGLMVIFAGLVGSGRMVMGPRRGSPSDRASRRLLGGLVLGACIVASQELVLNSSGLNRQVVSAHARFLPEFVIMLVAGFAVPTALVLLLVDQRTQQRARAADRARRRRAMRAANDNESMFSDSMLHTEWQRQPPPKP